MRKVLAVGAPVAAQISLEFWGFSTGPIYGLLWSYGAVGHMLALNLASIAFMFPLGISAAAYARREFDGRKHTADVGCYRCGDGIVAMSAMGMTFWTIPQWLLWPYQATPEVLAIALTLLLSLLFLQYLMGGRIVGVLRELGIRRCLRLQMWLDITALGCRLGWRWPFGGGGVRLEFGPDCSFACDCECFIGFASRFYLKAGWNTRRLMVWCQWRYD